MELNQTAEQNFHKLVEYIAQQISTDYAYSSDTALPALTEISYPKTNNVQLSFPQKMIVFSNDGTTYSHAEIFFTTQTGQKIIRVVPTISAIHIQLVTDHLPEILFTFENESLQKIDFERLLAIANVPALWIDASFVSQFLYAHAENKAIMVILSTLGKLKVDQNIQADELTEWIGQTLTKILMKNPEYAIDLVASYEATDFIASCGPTQNVLPLIMAGGIPFESIKK